MKQVDLNSQTHVKIKACTYVHVYMHIYAQAHTYSHIHNTV